MALTPLHTAVGMGITKIIPCPWISIPLALVSHFFLDRYPKWYNKENEYGSKEIITVVVEVLLMTFAVFVLFHEKNWLLWCGAISASFIDLWDAVNVVLKRREFWFCHPNGWFPLKVTGWQGPSMTALQTATLDSIFILVILGLILKGCHAVESYTAIRCGDTERDGRAQKSLVRRKAPSTARQLYSSTHGRMRSSPSNGDCIRPGKHFRAFLFAGIV